MDFHKHRLGLALPCTDSMMPALFVDSFHCLQKPLTSFYLRPRGRGPIDTIRNDLYEQAKRVGCSHILYMDTDQVYPANTIVRLLEHDLDICAAKVHRRDPPYDPILLRGPLDDYKPVPVSDWQHGGLVAVDATGFGCVLIKSI